MTLYLYFKLEYEIVYVLFVSVLAAVDRRGEESFTELHFDTHFGLVGESRNSTLLALNSHDNGSVAFVKF